MSQGRFVAEAIPDARFVELPGRDHFHWFENGDLVAAIAVNLAARVLGEACPGEVLATRTVRDLLLGSSLRFSERGIRRLKGVPEEWQLSKVTM